MALDRDAAERAVRRACRRAARPERDASGGRHSAHRRDRDVLCGQRRHHRARPRCRRFHDGHLWRRRAAACVGDRARDRHSPRDHPARPGISRLSACCSAICAAIMCAPASSGSPPRRSRRSRGFTPRWKPWPRAVARPRSGRSDRDHSAMPICAMSARSTPSRSISIPRCSRSRIATASSRPSTRCTCCATAPTRQRAGRDGQPARDGARRGARSRRKIDGRRGRAAESSAFAGRQPVYFRRPRFRRHAGLCARRAARRQRDRRARRWSKSMPRPRSCCPATD